MSKQRSNHKLYNRYKITWKSVLDAIEGGNAVKFANELYLPMPSGFLADDTSATQVQRSNTKTRDQTDFKDAPYYHENKAYMAYLHRARFPEITIHTMRGLMGVATRTDPEVKLPTKIKYMEELCTKKGDNIFELFAICVMEVLAQGRVTLVVDVNAETNTVSIVIYDAMSFTNWLDDEVTGKTKMAVFKECSYIQKPDDPFETEEKESYLCYSWEKEEGSTGEELQVTVTTQVGDDDPIKVVPSLQGSKFDRLPIVTIGSVENKNDPSPVPLLGVSEICYAIYRKDADLSQAQYMTCNPMFTITGVDSGVPVTFGSTVALVLSNPEANAFFPSTDTSALDHVSNAMELLKEEAATYGASLLGPTKKAAESNDTLKTRQGAQGASLVTVVTNVAKGIEEALEIAARISGASDAEVEFIATTDFAERSLSPQLLTALVSAWQAGAYSKESLIDLMIENGLAKGEVQDELSRILTDGPPGTVE